MQTVSIINTLLSILTVISQIAIVTIIFGVLFHIRVITDFFGTHALLFSFLIALIVTSGSLFYSDVAGYEPCKLCWYQRIFMYPQVIILGIALIVRDSRVRLYSVALSGIGFFIAGYHYLLQLGIAPNIPCSAVGYSVSCTKNFVMNFGYITIPLMSLTAFTLILCLWFTQAKSKKGSSIY
ncbi:disulfide bond formation protein B [Candidatus Uhrbacteria bacterium]|nr:disulfide bond formation protein B [Candidatus Uhrbacteria bacterium]